MLRTPLKNSKNVNKPFKSPFDSSAQKENKTKNVTNKNLKQEKETAQSPVSTRNLEAKRVLLLDEDEKAKKRRKISLDSEKIEEVPQKASKTSQAEVPQNAIKTDLLVLKRKIFEMRQELDCLKSRERCTKKHDPKDLKISIDKWNEACQNALEILCSELTERNGTSTKIKDILNMLGIPESIVCYSEKEDGFI